MKVKDYKGYEIYLSEYDGLFSIKDTDCLATDTLKKAEGHIDNLIKAESKGRFPIDVINISFERGKITSYNTMEKRCWFTSENGSRIKNKITLWGNNGDRPRFYNVNENNLALIKKYKELQNSINKLTDERSTLGGLLTEPVTF